MKRNLRKTEIFYFNKFTIEVKAKSILNTDFHMYFGLYIRPLVKGASRIVSEDSTPK